MQKGGMVMLANRLNVLLAERQLSIKQVVDETKISRNTISNIVNNMNANISTSTIDTLCLYLNVEPKEFFIYAPFNIQFYFDEQDNEESLILNIRSHERERNYALSVSINNTDAGDEDKERLEKYDLYITIDPEMGEKEIHEVYTDLPITFKTIVNNMLLAKIETILNFEHIEINVLDVNKQINRKKLFNKYTSSLGKNKFSVSIRLPWADLDKTMKFEKDTLNQFTFIK